MSVRLWLALTALLSLLNSGHAGSLLEAGGRFLKWHPEASDGRTVITYALLAGPYTLPDKARALSPDNCSAMRSFESILESTPAIPPGTARRELRSALDAWETAANIVFAEVADPHLANIVIGAQAFPVGRAFTNLSTRSGHGMIPVEKAIGAPGAAGGALKSAPDGTPTADIEQAYVCLNPQVRWKTGFDGDLNVYDLRHTFMHETGHAIGLDHPGGSGAIMAFRYDEQVRDLQPSDIEAVQRLYGPPQNWK